MLEWDENTWKKKKQYKNIQREMTDQIVLNPASSLSLMLCGISYAPVGQLYGTCNTFSSSVLIFIINLWFHFL